MTPILLVKAILKYSLLLFTTTLYHFNYFVHNFMTNKVYQPLSKPVKLIVLTSSTMSWAMERLAKGWNKIETYQIKWK